MIQWNTDLYETSTLCYSRIVTEVTLAYCYLDKSDHTNNTINNNKSNIHSTLHYLST